MLTRLYYFGRARSYSLGGVPLLSSGGRDLRGEMQRDDRHLQLPLVRDLRADLCAVDVIRDTHEAGIACTQSSSFSPGEKVFLPSDGRVLW